MTQDHRLTWGSLTISEPGEGTPSAEGYLIEGLADGFSLGNPETVIETVQSLLVDGSLAAITRYGNRAEVAIPVRLGVPVTSEVSAGPALAAAEAALFAQCQMDRPPPLVWTPPATDAAPCVLDVVAARLDRDNREGWDVYEVMREERFFLLTLTCLPFVRGEERVTVPALAPNPPSPTFDLLDDCSTVTNWAASSVGFGDVLRTNLFKNPSVEKTPFSTWSVAEPGEVNLGWANAGLFGSRAVSADRWTGSGNIRLFSPTTPISAGQEYTASVYARSISGFNNVTVRMQLRWLSSNGEFLGLLETSDQGLLGSWQPFSLTATAPAGAAKADIILIAEDAPVGDGYEADGYLLEQTGTPQAYFDGSTPDGPTAGYEWTGEANASSSVRYTLPVASVVSDSIVVSAPSFVYQSGTRWLRLTRTGALSMSGLPYLMVGARTEFAGLSGERKFFIDGSWRFPIAQRPSATDGYTDYFFETGDFSEFAVEWSTNAGTGELTATIEVAYLNATDTLPSIPREQTRQVTVTGSAPTQAALRLYDATGPLGLDTLVYTSRSQFVPMLMRDWHVSGTKVAEPAAVSGSLINLNGDEAVFRIPVSELPEGLYSLMVRGNKFSGSPNVTWSVKITDSAGADVLGSDVVHSGSLAPSGGAGWFIHALDALNLPTVAAEGDRYVQITFDNTTGSSEFLLDEVWLFSLTDGALTWFADATVTARWLEIRSPELDAPFPAVYASASGDGSNAADMSRACKPMGLHTFDGGSQVQIFTVTSTSQASSSEIEFYPRDHSHRQG